MPYGGALKLKTIIENRIENPKFIFSKATGYRPVTLLKMNLFTSIFEKFNYFLGNLSFYPSSYQNINFRNIYALLRYF